MILDDDKEAKGACGDVDTERVEQDASPHSTVTASELASRPTKPIDASGLWHNVEEPAPGLGSCEQHDVISAPTQ